MFKFLKLKQYWNWNQIKRIVLYVKKVKYVSSTVRSELQKYSEKYNHICVLILKFLQSLMLLEYI